MYTESWQYGKLIITMSDCLLYSSSLLGSSEGKQKMNDAVCYKTKYHAKYSQR